MKNFVAGIVFCGIILFSLGSSAAEKVNDDAFMAQTFVQIAMAEFQSVNDPSLDYPAINFRIYQTAVKMSKILFSADIADKEAAVIMKESAVWYGQALVALFNGKESGIIIPDYSVKLDALLRKLKLSLNVQEPIISLVSDDLQSMGSLFRDIET